MCRKQLVFSITNVFFSIIEWHAAVVVGIVLVLPAVLIQSSRAQTFTVLYSFQGTPDGAAPLGALIRDAAGNLYGTASFDGALGNGSVFRLSTTGREIAYNFAGYPNDGGNPRAALVMVDGALYGTAYFNGTFNLGAVFKIGATGESLLYSFSGHPDGSSPSTDLIHDNAGNLYGVTSLGGVYDDGTVFKLDPTGKETVLYSFHLGPSGRYPQGSLLADAVGNLYGTTSRGGTFDSGTVFKLDTTGKETVLYSFCQSHNCFDGSVPEAGLVLDTAGNLYGTTGGGGAFGLGTVFMLNKSGEVVLHSFSGVPNDGATPYSGVIRDSAGNLFGTTYNGGDSCPRYGAEGCGVVYKLDPTGKETVLHAFTGGTDGANPAARLIRDSAGNLYGTANFGGNPACFGGGGCGVVFEITP